MKFWLGASVWWLLLLPSVSLAQESSSSSSATTTSASSGGTRLKVHLPQSLKSPNAQGYDHRDALFGQQPAGGSIVQPLYYASQTDFCVLSDMLVHPVTYLPNKPPMGDPFLLMVDRGGCTFVKKVRNAQHMGAAGVLIADNKCLCSDQACMNATQASDCESQEPFMADDGSGSDITIPSFLVPKHDADTFKETLKTTAMRVEMEFPPPPEVIVDPAVPLPTPVDPAEGNDNNEGDDAPKALVTIDFWYTPTDFDSVEFIRRFRAAAMVLQPQAQLIPHPYVYDGVASSCQLDGQQQQQENSDEPEGDTPWQNQPCYNLCTNGGRYCATDPDDDLEEGVSGAQVVEESLRQICIASQPSDGSTQWWNYVHEFQSQCFTSTLFHDVSCLSNVFKDAGVSEDAVNSCMEHSGGLTGRGTNNKLETELDLQKSRGIYMLPTLHLNGAPYSGPMHSDLVFSAVCAEFSYETKPDICHQCANCADSMDCVLNNGVCPMSTILVSPSSEWTTSATTTSSNSMPGDVIMIESANVSSSGGVSHFTFLSSVFVVVALAGLLAAWHRRRSRDEMRTQVQGIMADYMPLHGDVTSSTIDFSSSAMDFAGRGGTENSLLP